MGPPPALSHAEAAPPATSHARSHPYAVAGHSEWSGRAPLPPWHHVPADRPDSSLATNHAQGAPPPATNHAQHHPRGGTGGPERAGPAPTTPLPHAPAGQPAPTSSARHVQRHPPAGTGGSWRGGPAPTVPPPRGVTPPGSVVLSATDQRRPRRIDAAAATGAPGRLGPAGDGRGAHPRGAPARVRVGCPDPCCSQLTPRTHLVETKSRLHPAIPTPKHRAHGIDPLEPGCGLAVTNRRRGRRTVGADRGTCARRPCGRPQCRTVARRCTRQWRSRVGWDRVPTRGTPPAWPLRSWDRRGTLVTSSDGQQARPIPL